MTARKPVADPETDRAVLLRKIAIAKAPAWRPEAGDIRTGILINVRRGEGDYGPYPVTVWQDVVNGVSLDTYYCIHLFHGLAKAWFAENLPTIGNMITCSYLGKVERTDEEKKAGKSEYHDYFFCFGDGSDNDTPETAEIDYSLFAPKDKKAE